MLILDYRQIVNFFWTGTNLNSFKSGIPFLKGGFVFYERPFKLHSR